MMNETNFDFNSFNPEKKASGPEGCPDSFSSRTEALLGAAAVTRLRSAHVAVFGLGGVGSYVTEALARAGVGHLSLIDSDRVSESNRNRQLYALRSTLGQKKTAAAKERCLDINEHMVVDIYDAFVTPDNAEELLARLCARRRADAQEPRSDSNGAFCGFALMHNEANGLSYAAPGIDFVVDAIDTVSAKIALALLCENAALPLISCCGTGNKLDPTRFEIADIYETSVCPLCKVLRKNLKARGVKQLTVCYSKEPPAKTGSRTPASVSFVPGAAGLVIAGHVIRALTADAAGPRS